MLFVEKIFGDLPDISDRAALGSVLIFQSDSHKLAGIDADHGVNRGRKLDFKSIPLPVPSMLEHCGPLRSRFERYAFGR